MPSCECGAHVTPSFARVFGDNSDEITACPECSIREVWAPGGVR